jgi:aryl-phospho-beta-D-glucosidase BglC (GH1 family)
MYENEEQFTDETLQERFICLWEELARRFGGLSGRVAFELLNEVTDQVYGPLWNRVAARAALAATRTAKKARKADAVKAVVNVVRAAKAAAASCAATTRAVTTRNK